MIDEELSSNNTFSSGEYGICIKVLQINISKWYFLFNLKIITVYHKIILKHYL